MTFHLRLTFLQRHPIQQLHQQTQFIQQTPHQLMTQRSAQRPHPQNHKPSWSLNQSQVAPRATRQSNHQAKDFRSLLVPPSPSSTQPSNLSKAWMIWVRGLPPRSVPSSCCVPATASPLTRPLRLYPGWTSKILPWTRETCQGLNVASTACWMNALQLFQLGRRESFV